MFLTMKQGRLDDLTVLSVESDVAKKIDFSDVNDAFALKLRKVILLRLKLMGKCINKIHRGERGSEVDSLLIATQLIFCLNFCHRIHTYFV